MKKRIKKLIERIRRNQKNNSKEFLMSRRSLLIGNYGSIQASKKLLDSAELVLRNSINLDHALGLYTLACEEFGKAIVLKESLDGGGEKIQKIPKYIFGFGANSHKKKLKKAIKNLPQECTQLPIGENITIPSGKKMKMKLGISDAILVTPANTTGVFLTDVSLVPKIRERCFYVDWDETSDNWHKWRLNLQTDKKSLQKAIDSFRKELSKQKIGKSELS